ncbi:MAG: cytochrome c3 family protein [Gammaproteobacteria bacterium]
MAGARSDRISDDIKRLQRPPRGRRALSWLLFLSILAGFLILPLLASSHGAAVLSWLRGMPALETRVRPVIERHTAAVLDRRPVFPEHSALSAAAPRTLAPPTLLALDRSWDPGSVAAAHGPWAGDCKLCHTTPFVRVQDSACRSCHAGIGDHVDPLQHASVPGLTDVRCASCHRDHRGVFGLAEQNRHYLGAECASCHADIRRHAPASSSANVTDFAADHPEFRVQIRRAADDPELERVRLQPAAPLREPTNLSFPHDVHLAARGIDSPHGRVRLDCADCHVPSAVGLGFRPTTMREHCQQCHALALEPALSDREVPHGPVTEVVASVREFYAYLQLAGERGSATRSAPALGVQRPGQGARAVAGSKRSLPDHAQRARAAAVRLFEETSCTVCHVVSRSAEGPPDATAMPDWRIAPIDPAHAWMPQSAFDHRSHHQQPCTDCHDAARSAHAEEVLMPRIEICRDCHAGSQPSPLQVTSDCGLCHGFHLPGRLPSARPATAMRAAGS